MLVDLQPIGRQMLAVADRFASTASHARAGHRRHGLVGEEGALATPPDSQLVCALPVATLRRAGEPAGAQAHAVGRFGAVPRLVR